MKGCSENLGSRTAFSLAEIMVVFVVMAGILLLAGRFVFTDRQNEYDAKYSKLASAISANVDKDLILKTGFKFKDYDTSALVEPVLNTDFQSAVTKNLNQSPCSDCWSDNTDISIGAESYDLTEKNFNFYKLNDKQILAVNRATTDIFIDVNGKAAPNEFGKDIRKWRYSYRTPEEPILAGGGDNPEAGSCPASGDINVIAYTDNGTCKYKCKNPNYSFVKVSVSGSGKDIKCKYDCPANNNAGVSFAKTGSGVDTSCLYNCKNPSDPNVSKTEAGSGPNLTCGYVCKSPSNNGIKVEQTGAAENTTCSYGCIAIGGVNVNTKISANAYNATCQYTCKANTNEGIIVNTGHVPQNAAVSACYSCEPSTNDKKVAKLVGTGAGAKCEYVCNNQCEPNVYKSLYGNKEDVCFSYGTNIVSSVVYTHNEDTCECKSSESVQCADPDNSNLEKFTGTDNNNSIFKNGLSSYKTANSKCTNGKTNYRNCMYNCKNPVSENLNFKSDTTSVASSSINKVCNYECAKAGNNTYVEQSSNSYDATCTYRCKPNTNDGISVTQGVVSKDAANTDCYRCEERANQTVKLSGYGSNARCTYTCINPANNDRVKLTSQTTNGVKSCAYDCKPLNNEIQKQDKIKDAVVITKIGTGYADTDCTYRCKNPDDTINVELTKTNEDTINVYCKYDCKKAITGSKDYIDVVKTDENIVRYEADGSYKTYYTNTTKCAYNCKSNKRGGIIKAESGSNYNDKECSYECLSPKDTKNVTLKTSGAGSGLSCYYTCNTPAAGSNLSLKTITSGEGINNYENKKCEYTCKYFIGTSYNSSTGQFETYTRTSPPSGAYMTQNGTDYDATCTYGCYEPRDSVNVSVTASNDNTPKIACSYTCKKPVNTTILGITTENKLVNVKQLTTNPDYDTYENKGCEYTCKKNIYNGVVVKQTGSNYNDVNCEYTCMAPKDSHNITSTESGSNTTLNCKYTCKEPLNDNATLLNINNSKIIPEKKECSYSCNLPKYPKKVYVETAGSNYDDKVCEYKCIPSNVKVNIDVVDDKGNFIGTKYDYVEVTPVGSGPTMDCQYNNCPNSYTCPAADENLNIEKFSFNKSLCRCEATCKTGYCLNDPADPSKGCSPCSCDNPCAHMQVCQEALKGDVTMSVNGDSCSVFKYWSEREGGTTYNITKLCKVFVDTKNGICDYKAAISTTRRQDPLLFDIAGDGEITASNNIIEYDIDGDGKLESINDVNSAVLCFDKNKDGICGKDGSELFGDSTKFGFEEDDFEGYEDGFDALKALARYEGLINDDDDMLLDENDIKYLEENWGLKIKKSGYFSNAESLIDTKITQIKLSNSEKKWYEKYDDTRNKLMIQEDSYFVIDNKVNIIADMWHAVEEAIVDIGTIITSLFNN